MGLDMNLLARRHIRGYDASDAHLVEGIRNLDFGTNGLEPTAIVFDAMYWRKANAIHRWFVENVQDDVDNCGEYFVSLDKLHELRDICKEVLEDNSKASVLLPPQAGFFFGSTEVDEWYLTNLKDTVERFNELFEMECVKNYGVDFYYTSSW
jgi:hypothetical protein